MFPGLTAVKSVGDTLREASRFEFRTILRSVLLSRRHIGRLDGLIIGPKAIVNIEDGATLDIDRDSRLVFATGDKRFAATDSRLGRSKLEITKTGEFTISGGNARVGPCSIISVEGTFTMGSSYINSHARIVCGDEITIGDNCAIAWNVEMLDDDRHHLRIDGKEVRKTEPIRIEDNVWIGNNVIIKKGVTVGEGAIVASGSVLTEDVPARALVGGNPATVLRTDIDWQ